MMRRQEMYQLMTAAALAAALSLPMAAQQTATPDTTPAATQQTAATGTTLAAPQAMTEEQVQQRQLKPQIKQGFWGKLNPFARKKYVRTQLQPIRDRVNELDGLSAANARSINDVDQRAQSGIHRAQDQADQANQQASAAQQQVQQVQQQAQQLDQQVSTVNTKLQNADQYQVAQTAELRFRPGRARLSDSAQQQLDSFLNGLDNQKGYLIEVEATAPGRGLAAMENSQHLADTVVRYLVLQHNIPLYRIYTSGLGNAPMQASASGLRGSRRTTHGGMVQIKILRNSIAMASNSPAATPADQ